ncbi:SRPBCC family protein [Paenibacillus pinistramenti]|uniref:SRPBCC family protein n=1 Tax=Paenibacillus pinistramenti TaxID=1768003 RepID=UPI001107E062|nr:SRPBCC domain-containing protein [Paenibacillus pinistramenti]
MSENQHGFSPEVHKQAVFKAPIEKVWAAVATSDGIAAWFMPNTFEPVVGHEFILKAGPFGDSPCKVTELDPPTRLSFTWGKDWTLSFELKDLGGQTEFHLYHKGWDADKVTEFGQPHPVVQENMANGWTGLVAKLQGLVEQ